MFIDDVSTARAEAFLDANAAILIVSDFAAAEFVSAIARRVRIGEITRSNARTAFAHFDDWTLSSTQRVETSTRDISAAERLLRRLDLPLRTPDALNIAIAQRLGAAVLTFDKQMRAAVQTLGTPIADN